MADEATTTRPAVCGNDLVRALSVAPPGQVEVLRLPCSEGNGTFVHVVFRAAGAIEPMRAVPQLVPSEIKSARDYHAIDRALSEAFAELYDRLMHESVGVPPVRDYREGEISVE